GAHSTNSGHIGIEMLADSTGYGFTNAQYEALAKLVADIARRHKLPITSAPSARLLGHEDVHPLSRQNKGGGWDPGAHRDKPKFSWSRLWALVKSNP
ncbi:MAG: N-acetylmuramoyl-L-alanine amidase, partial [Acidobacteriota bacterium]